MEESIPSSIKSGSQKGIPPREVIEFVTQGELQTSSFKLAKSDEKVNQRIPIFLLYIVILCFITFNFNSSK